MATTIGCGDDTSSNNGNGSNGGNDVIAGNDSGSTTDTGPEPDSTTNCSADCNGALANNPQGLCSLYDAKYASGNVTCDAATCTVNTSACQEGTVGPVPGEFEACTDACAEGLVCVGWTPSMSYCLKPCASEDDTSCGANACTAVGDTDNDGVLDAFVCLKKDAMVNDPCLDNLTLCADGQGECQWTDLEDGPQGPTPTGFRCKINCESDADCGGNSCLQNPVGKVSVEQVNGAPISCMDDSACGDGFECINLTNGMSCAKIINWCGTEALACAAQLDEAGLTECIEDPASDCSMGGSGLCAVVGATGDPADVLCIPVDASGTKSICVGFCGGEDGNATLDCGEGYQCVRPETVGVLLPETQKDAMGNPISCTLGDDSACDTANEFKCVTGQNEAPVCGRPFKMCQKI